MKKLFKAIKDMMNQYEAACKENPGLYYEMSMVSARYGYVM